MFTGPVRKWKKRWTHVSPPNNNNQINTNRTNSLNNGTTTHGNNNGSSSHLFLYKWTPLSQINNNNSNATTNGAAAAEKNAIKEDEERPKRKFKYIPIAVLEEQERELEEVEMVDEETKPTDIDPNAGPTSITDGLDEKPDINDVPMEENEESNLRQDLNESFDLTAHEGDSDSKT
jgi:hypothetical protein